MKLTDFVIVDAITPDLKSDTKEVTIRNLVATLKDAGKIKPDDESGIVEAILKREELGSTGIGKGVAVPHTKHPSVDELICAVALCSEGIEFASLDGDDVYILFLLVSPPDRPAEHLRALECISRSLKKNDFCNFLRQAKSRKDIIDLINESDSDQI